MIMICFIFGGCLAGSTGARQAVTGLVFPGAGSMFMCRSDVDAKPKRQDAVSGCRGLQLGSAATVLEHKWATLNSNGHTAADVTAVLRCCVCGCTITSNGTYKCKCDFSYCNTVPEKHHMTVVLAASYLHDFARVKIIITIMSFAVDISRFLWPNANCSL